MIAEELLGYETHPEMTSCYLDGRCFYKAFQDYAGLVPNSLRIRFFREEGQLYHSVTMSAHELHPKVTSVVRVIMEFLDHTFKAGVLLINAFENKGVWFEPIETPTSEEHPTHSDITGILVKFLHQSLPSLEIHDASLELAKQKPPECDHSAFCNAAILKFAWCFLNNLEFQPHLIKKFAGKAEILYLQEKQGDVAFGRGGGGGFHGGGYHGGGGYRGGYGGRGLGYGGFGAGLLGGTLLGLGLGGLYGGYGYPYPYPYPYPYGYYV